MGISKAYGRAIGTNFGFPCIAQSPPPEPELPLSQRRRGALAREGGKRAKLGKPTLRTSGSSMLIANQQKDSLRFPGDFQDTSTSPAGELHGFQIDSKSPPNRPARGLQTDDLRNTQLAHLFEKGSNSGNPPTARSGAYWPCPFICLIWPGGGAGFVQSLRSLAA